jgi:hypothetical protein
MLAEGWKVTVKTGPGVVSADANGRDLVFISQSVTSADVNTKFRLSPVPVVMSETGVADDMDLCTTVTFVIPETQILLINTPSAVSGTDVGLQTIAGAVENIPWMDPNPATALLWALNAGGTAGHYVWYGYEIGVTMRNALNAPARRSCLSSDMSSAGAPFLNAKGLEYMLRMSKWGLGIL